MAVLARGSKYGLSQCKSSDKTLCFVKLTDSALKAIEEFSRQRARFGVDRDAQIQFSKNEGIIRIPSLQPDARTGKADPQWFKFTVTPSAEQDGPHCSNECVQQVKQQSLCSLGPLLYKIRVQAKDDVYELTKQKMTSVLEENEKNCTKMIKPCAMSGGRKIKVKSGTVRPHPTLHPTLQVPSTNPTMTRPFGGRDIRRLGFSGRGPGPGPGSSSSGSGPSSGNGTRGPDAQKLPSLASTNSGPSSSSVLPSNSSLPNAQKASGGLVNQRHSSPAPGTSRRGAVTDIMKRPLRERIVHLLAVRPYKKPELVDRLRRDGLRDKDNVTTALIGIAYMKDNTYHLAKHAWSEVNEDWPFYTLQDKQTIKWRKPETLTPPSDSSSSSGNSPGPNSGSTSPPGNGSANYKRQSFFDSGDAGIPPKKVRISHYKRPQAGPDDSRIILPPGNGFSQSGPGSSLVCGSGISFGSRGSFKSDMLPSSRQAQQQPRGPAAGSSQMSSSSTSSASTSSAASSSSSSSSSGGWNPGRNLGMMTESARNEMTRRSNYPANSYSAPGPSTAMPATSARDPHGEQDWRTKGNGYRQATAPLPVAAAAPPATVIPTVTDKPSGSGLMSTTSMQPTPESSPDARRHEDPEPPTKKPSTATCDFSPDDVPKDFLKDFVKIETWEQRNHYKAIFNAEYEEYRKLYAKFNGIAQQFSTLEENLKKCEAGTEARAGARQRIRDEYAGTKNADYVEKRRRLSYLHLKLAHIKELVVDFHNRHPIDA